MGITVCGTRRVSDGDGSLIGMVVCGTGFGSVGGGISKRRSGGTVGAGEFTEGPSVSGGIDGSVMGTAW